MRAAAGAWRLCPGSDRQLGPRSPGGCGESGVAVCGGLAAQPNLNPVASDAGREITTRSQQAATVQHRLAAKAAHGELADWPEAPSCMPKLESDMGDWKKHPAQRRQCALG